MLQIILSTQRRGQLCHAAPAPVATGGCGAPCAISGRLVPLRGRSHLSKAQHVVPTPGRVHVLNPKAPASVSVAPFRGRLLTSWFLCKGRGCWCALGEKTSKLERNVPESLAWGLFLRSRTPSARLRCARARVRQIWHQGGGRLSVRAQG